MKKYLLLSIAAASALTFLGCNETTTPTELSFSEAPVPTSDLEKRSILASEKVNIHGKEHTIGYNTIIRSGDQVGVVLMV